MLFRLRDILFAVDVPLSRLEPPDETSTLLALSLFYHL